MSLNYNLYQSFKRRNVIVEERRMGMWPYVRERRKKDKTSYPAPRFEFVAKSTSFESLLQLLPECSMWKTLTRSQ